MAELSKILKKEEEQKEIVETAKKKSQSEIEDKKQALALELEPTTITEEQKDKVLEYKEQQIKEINKKADKDIENEVSQLQNKSKANTDKAVNYILKTLVNH